MKRHHYQELCDRLCTHIMSRQVGIRMKWETPIPPFFEGIPTKKPFREDVRLEVRNFHIHYYQRGPAGEENEIPPEKVGGWFPDVPEFEYPPATEEQLQATESELGFPLPPLLRTLYAQIANGGFGPGNGLLGAKGGGDKDGFLLTEEYHRLQAETQPIDFISCERQATPLKNNWGFCTFLSDQEVSIPNGYWPEGFLPISHDGGGWFFYLDTQTDRVFFGPDYDISVRLVANSLEDLFERWMRDELFNYEAFQEHRRKERNEWAARFPEIDFSPFPDFPDL